MKRRKEKTHEKGTYGRRYDVRALPGARPGVDGVAEVVVDLETKQAAVTLAKDVPDRALADVVTAAGYTVTSVAEV